MKLLHCESIIKLSCPPYRESIDPLKHEIYVNNSETLSPRCAQKTPRLHYKTVHLMLFWEFSLINHTTPACTLCGQNAEFLNLRAGYGSHSALDFSAVRLIRTRHIVLVVHLRFSKQLRARLYSCGI